MVFTGQQNTCATCTPTDAEAPSIAADTCCGYINFFTTQNSAGAWADNHPDITGQTLSRKVALETATQIFGPLLTLTS